MRADLRELAILVAAREHGQANEWNSHRPLGEREGLEPALLDAIAARQRPTFGDDGQRIVYEATVQLCATTDLDDATYSRLESLLGERAVVEFVTTVGFYTMLAMLLNATRAELPEGVVPPFPCARG